MDVVRAQCVFRGRAVDLFSALGAHRALRARCARSRLFLAQAEAQFPHSDPPPFASRTRGEWQREVYQKGSGQPI